MYGQNKNSCVIIGAGIAGLLAGTKLRQAGWAVTVLEKSRGVGGRMASRRLADGTPTARADHGAQYFTATSARFQALVDQWMSASVVRHWSDGFNTPDGPKRDGRSRYIGAGGMTAVPKWLAADLDVRLNSRVARIEPAQDAWEVVTDDGVRLQAAVVIMTPPVPQSLALLDAGRVVLPPDVRQQLDRIAYDPSLALLVALDSPSKLPAPGGLWPTGGSIIWMADNAQKGISDRPVVTIHAQPAFARQHFDADPDRVAEQLLDEAAPWLGGVLSYQLHRWRYSIPTVMCDAPFVVIDEPAPLFFAGDAFAGPRVEGAALSGLAVVDRILA